MRPQPRPTIRDLYPDLSDDEPEEVEKNLDRYLEVVLGTYERLLANPEACDELQRLREQNP